MTTLIWKEMENLGNEIDKYSLIQWAIIMSVFI